LIEVKRTVAAYPLYEVLLAFDADCHSLLLMHMLCILGLLSSLLILADSCEINGFIMNSPGSGLNVCTMWLRILFSIIV
jgi:hypothetical protein